MGEPRVVTEIVERIADYEGVDPLDLHVQLSDAVDAVALEALTDHTDGRQTQATLRVEFSYYGYAITVDGSGEVFIDE